MSVGIIVDTTAQLGTSRHKRLPVHLVGIVEDDAYQYAESLLAKPGFSSRPYGLFCFCFAMNDNLKNLVNKYLLNFL